jgi:biotin carboxyl carrier protein
MISREVRDYVYGLYGQPPAPIDPEVQRVALAGYERGQTPITCRAADLLEPELEKAKADTAGLARDLGDILCYALYPTTGLRFLKWKYGVEQPPPGTAARTLEDIKREDDLIAKAKKGLLVDPATMPQPAPAPSPLQRRRTFNVRVGGEAFVVEVEPEGGAPIVTAWSEGAPPVSPRQAPASTVAPPSMTQATSSALSSGETAVVAPMPGLVIRYLVSQGDRVTRGKPVLVLEAMKMENSLPAPVDGEVKRLTRTAGDAVARGDVLAVIGG